MDLYKPFNCDEQEEIVIKNLIKKFNIDCCVETGTYTGNTTLWFSNLVNKVYTFEIADNWYNYALNKFKKNSKNNIEIIKNDSAIGMVSMLPIIKKTYKNVLFFLDAHWQDKWPLHDELSAIAKNYNGDNGFIIIIDDFEVPNRNFQFDCYKKKSCNIDFVREKLKELQQHVYFYKNTSKNSHPKLRAGCIGVGKLYIISKNLLEQNNVNESELFFNENNINYAL